MTDEKFVFVSDVSEKKRVARGAFNKRTHAGKRGAVKFPSDFLNKKELNAMNGEVKSYRLNDPMTYAEFKSMPDDIKVTYIKLLRERYNVSDTMISEMFGCSQKTVSNEFIRLGISRGKGKGKTKCDADGWSAFLNGVFGTVTETNPIVESAVQECEVVESAVQECEVVDKSVSRLDITSGQIAFVGDVNSVFEVVKQLVGESSVRMTVTWECL